MGTPVIVFPPLLMSASAGGVSLDYTLAGETSNSYCSLTYANTYWAAHYNATASAQWAALSDPQKIVLLTQACRSIERIRFTFQQALPQYSLHYDRRTRQVVDLNLTRDPVRYYYYQRLQFPRNIDIYYTSPPVGVPLGSLFMREEPQNAQCEQAMYTLNLDQSASSNRLQGIVLETISIGKGQIVQTHEYGSSGTQLSPVAIEILSGLMVREGRLSRG